MFGLEKWFETGQFTIELSPQMDSNPLISKDQKGWYYLQLLVCLSDYALWCLCVANCLTELTIKGFTVVVEFLSCTGFFKLDSSQEELTPDGLRCISK